MTEHSINIIRTEYGITLRESNPIFLEDEERAWQDYLRRRAYNDMVMVKNKLRRQCGKNT